jgi:hypothetical protein
MVIESTAPTAAIERIALKFRLEIFDIAVFSCARIGRGSIHFSNMPPDKSVAAVVYSFIGLHWSSLVFIGGLRRAASGSTDAPVIWSNSRQRTP